MAEKSFLYRLFFKVPDDTSDELINSSDNIATFYDTVDSTDYDTGYDTNYNADYSHNYDVSYDADYTPNYDMVDGFQYNTEYYPEEPEQPSSEVCSVCGKANLTQSKFCIYCGTPTTSTTPDNHSKNFM